jgi:hypothetical protein
LKKSYLLALSFALVSLAPCLAQDEITNNQPVVGALNKTETRIQSKLTEDFNKGLIDSDQLGQFQRDFDGILDHENVLQTGGGMNESGKKSILKDLSSFEARLDKQAGINKPAKKQ